MCAVVSEDHGVDCVSQTFTGGCGDVTVQGTCDEDGMLVYCESFETGEVEQVECEEGTECCPGADGFFDCLPPGAMGCGSLTARGVCNAGTATWCDEEAQEVIEVVCEGNASCAMGPDGYRCIERQEGGHSVSGSWSFEKRPLTAGGYLAPVERPVRYATVAVLRTSDSLMLASTQTDEEGRYALEFEADEGQEVQLVVMATAGTDRHAISVQDCPQCGPRESGNVHAAGSAPFEANGATDLGELVVPIDGVAGAFNIFDLFVGGFDFAIANLGRRPPPLKVQWVSGSNTRCGTSCAGAGTVWVLSTPNDTDEFDDPVLGHEFGHFIEQSFSRSVSPGGPHNGSPTDPRLAWGEGYGTFFGAELADSSVYLDGFASGTLVREVNNDRPADGADRRGMQQLVSEYPVAAILWKASRGTPGTDGVGSAAIFDILGGYFLSDFLADRGVRGVDLVDFLDGLRCRGAENADDFIDDVVVGTHDFPYDFSGPEACR